jgi:hypothetical protein
MPPSPIIRASAVAAIAISLAGAGLLVGLRPAVAQQPAQGGGQPADLGPQMRRILAPLQPQDYQLRPVGRTLGDLLNQGWEMVSAGGVNAAELYVLRQRGKYVRCLLLPTDVSSSRPERISLCAELN